MMVDQHGIESALVRDQPKQLVEVPPCVQEISHRSTP